MSETRQGQFQCLVHQDVRKGEELTFTYGQQLLYMTKSQREVYAKEQFGGPGCACDHCTSPPAKLLVSDMRRHMLRVLSCSLWDTDLPWMEARNEPRPQLSQTNLSIAQRHEIWTRIAEAEGILGAVQLPFEYLEATMAVVEDSRRSGNWAIPQKELTFVKNWTARAIWRKYLSFGSDVHQVSAERYFQEATQTLRKLVKAGGDLRVFQWE